MSKRQKRKQNKANQQKAETANRRPTRKWRELRRFALVFGLLATVVGTGLAAFKHSYDISHDLSVIGQGTPVVVQIHDPNCSLCNQLRRHAGNAIDHFGEERLLYRIADISTPGGRQLQMRHQVPHVTLLLFDGKGEVRRVLNGVKGEDTLKHAFDTHLKRWGAKVSAVN